MCGMLEVRDLRQRFGALVALDGVAFSVGPGEIVGLVGRNGAGKTTTMRAVMGILASDRGTVTWDGQPIGDRDRFRFGYMPEERGLYPQMRLLDQVAYFARLHGLDSAAAVDCARRWLDRLGLGERAGEKLIAPRTGTSSGSSSRLRSSTGLSCSSLTSRSPASIPRRSTRSRRSCLSGQRLAPGCCSQATSSSSSSGSAGGS